MMECMTTKFDIGQVKIDVLGVAKVRRNFEELAEIFPGVEKTELKEAIRNAQPDNDGNYLDWYFNSILIRSPDQTILVDTGFGFSGGGPGSGIEKLLEKCGVQPSKVHTIVITHGHGDHIGGLINGGAPAMPDARIVISRKEFEFWMEGQGERFTGSESASQQQSTFTICRNQIERIEMDSPISESADTTIRALPSPGHTPGHIGIEVSSAGKRMWLLADIIHAPFQLEHTDWSPRFDVNPDLARTTRRELLNRAAQLELPVHLYHFPFPGLGTVLPQGRGFAFKAIDRS
jgi:glyoxylase-like metal-dependent hydrolase (beta-lactamase superfamily II)